MKKKTRMRWSVPGEGRSCGFSFYDGCFLNRTVFPCCGKWHVGIECRWVDIGTKLQIKKNNFPHKKKQTNKYLRLLTSREIQLNWLQSYDISLFVIDTLSLYQTVHTLLSIKNKTALKVAIVHKLTCENILFGYKRRQKEEKHSNTSHN